jgi:carbonic anhydrase
MRTGRLVTALLLASAALVAADPAPDLRPAQEAIDRLHQGNIRFFRDQPVHARQLMSRRAYTAAEGQKPFATVLACSDSRVPVELLFDQGVGDVFTIRVAGNVCGQDEAGSIEYGIAHVGTPLLVILGHTACGAVTAAVDGAEPHGNIAALLDRIGPAVALVDAARPPARVERFFAGVRENVWQAMRDLLQQSRETRRRVTAGQLTIAAAVYHIDTGVVEWLGTHEKLGRGGGAASR